MARISVRPDPNEAGGAIVTIANGGASSDGLRYFIRRKGYAEPNLAPSGWQVAESALEPSGAEATPQGLEIHVPAEVIRHLEDGNYELSVTSGDGASLSGVLSWEGSLVPRGPSGGRARRRGRLYGGEPPKAKEPTKPEPGETPAEDPATETDDSEPQEPDKATSKEPEVQKVETGGTGVSTGGKDETRKSPVALIAGAVLLLAVIAGGLYFWLASSQNPVTALTDGDATANSVAESAADGATVGVTGLASDPDSGDTVTYQLTDDAGGRFGIDETSGVVTVANSGALDFESATSHQVTVEASSSDGSTSTETFTIEVTDDTSEFAVEAIADGDDQANSVSESAPDETAVGITAGASDADGTDSVTYALTDDAGGRFRIDANSGVISVADSAALDYESASNHEVTVTATSSDGSTATAVLTIELTDDTSEVVATPEEPDLRAQIDAWLNGDPTPNGQELLDKANELLDMAAEGNADARSLAAQLLRKAVRQRNGEAALTMGRYFDPRELSPGRLRQRERPDPSNAYKSYRAAKKLGAADATEDLTALKEWAESKAADGDAEAQQLLDAWLD